MNVYVCTDHEGHWGVGVASVVIAPDQDTARGLLVEELKTHGLVTTQPFTLRKINAVEPRAFVLNDGDY